jgi:hypothetical protein
LQNGRGILAGIYFSMDKPVDRVHASVDQPGALGPPWTDGCADRGGGRGVAARSSELGLRPLRCTKAHGRERKGREEHGELSWGLTGAQAMA